MRQLVWPKESKVCLQELIGHIFGGLLRHNGIRDFLKYKSFSWAGLQF